MPILASILILTNLAYTAAFDTDTRSPAWVEYTLSSPSRTGIRRTPHAFRADPRVPGSDFARDYARSGYDRGHLAPAADFASDEAAVSETYLYTNVIPQNPAVNRGLWREIEEDVRALAASGTVRVLVAPLYDPAVTGLCGRVRVPDSIFKAVWGPFGCRVYRVPNDTIPPSDRKSGVTNVVTGTITANGDSQ